MTILDLIEKLTACAQAFGNIEVFVNDGDREREPAVHVFKDGEDEPPRVEL
jgi:hypothetical protein